MRRLALSAVLAAALPVQAAETPMSAAAFERYTTGYTLTFAENGVVYGIEQYLPGRRVRWSVAEGECREGDWFAEAGQICFVYDDDPERHCWSFFETARGLTARYESGPDGPELYEAQKVDTPLYCMGPDIGA